LIESTQENDESLLAAIVNGQSAALGTLYDRYARLVFSLAVNMINDEAVAEEITQDVFLQVWKKSATYQNEHGKVAAWLTGITRHRAIDILRRKGSRPEGHLLDWTRMVEEPDLPDGEIPVENQIELKQQGLGIRQAISDLPLEQQQVVEMAYFHGLTQEEIALQTGEPLGTVKTRIRLAMQKLRNQLSY
jgi:RNA polymerase sigma-70 factor (ECF subfamily)